MKKILMSLSLFTVLIIFNINQSYSNILHPKDPPPCFSTCCEQNLYTITYHCGLTNEHYTLSCSFYCLDNEGNHYNQKNCHL